MTVLKEVLLEEKKIEGNCILVGLQIDSNGKELLDWALSKVAKRGDRVIAVHVCRDSDLRRKSAMVLIKLLDDLLAAYESHCILKKIFLIGRVSQGNSIRQVVVKEANVCKAMTVVVGANKNCYSLGVSTSLARYCAKKLSSSTSLFGIHNGKVIFEREATKLPSGGETKPNLGSILHPSVSMDAKIVIPSSKSRPDMEIHRLSNPHHGHVKEKGGVSRDPSPLRHNQMAGSESSSISIQVRKSPESGAGWPLLRRAVSADLNVAISTDARKISVVQWVMNLPNRSSPDIPRGNTRKFCNPRRRNGAPTSIYLCHALKNILGRNPSKCKWFRYEELQNSTNQFAKDNLIGNGGSSRVYKGCLDDGQQVAIKLSKLSAEASKDFLSEVEIMTALQHERIVPLIGICVKENNLISVYSYFSQGSLEENLNGAAKLPWDMRFKVAIGIAEALNYLHSNCARPVIHRDVKSSNILLSDEFDPQLSDFGLAIWAPANSSYLTHGDVVGTFGYLAPEYFMYGKVSDKLDVYAFGVVLLELLTGRKPISTDNPKGQESLVMLAAPLLDKGRFMDLLDPNLEGKFDEDQMQRMVLAASLCITRAACLRPQMCQIITLLRGEEDIETWMNSFTTSNSNELDWQDESYPASSIGSHVGLALLDVEDNLSIASFEQSNLSSSEEYMRGLWSRSPSFD